MSDATGELKVEEVAKKPLKQDMLNTNDCFILDSGTKIFVWVGRNATDQERKQSMTRAQGFLKTKKYPTWTKVTRVVEGGETTLFKQFFLTWKDNPYQHTRLIRAAQDDDSVSGSNSD